MANGRYEGVGLDGHYTLSERIFTKIKNLFDIKVKTDVPANAVFTDTNTTYTLSADTANNKIKLTPNSGAAQSITVPYATSAGSAGLATKATQDESGNNIKESYAASFNISDHTITLKNKNGTSLGTVTVPDNNTWRGIQNNLTSTSTTDSLSAAQGKILNDTKLEKTTYEWNKEVSFGSSGYLKIGSFAMYDSNVTIEINSTANTTYHGTLVIATQNVTSSSIGSIHVVKVYDDPTGVIAESLRIVWTNGSRNYDIYFVPSNWSKNLIHIQALGLYGYSDICTTQTGTPPTTTTGLEPINVLASKSAVSGGTDVSMVTTGEKATWNAKGTGTITSIKTTAGAHTTINVTSGAANFNIPTKTSHLTNDSGYTTLTIGTTATTAMAGNTNVNNVTQTNTTNNADYRVLLSYGANDTTQTNTIQKNTNLKYNPSTGNLQTTKLNGVTVGSSPKFTDTDTHRPIQVNGTTILGITNTTALNLVSGDNVSMTNSGGSVTISSDQIDDSYDYDDYQDLPDSIKMQDKIFMVKDAPNPSPIPIVDDYAREQIVDIKSNLTTLSNKVEYISSTNLRYSSASKLVATLTFSEIVKSASVTMLEASGTPYAQVSRLTISGLNSKNLGITAWGSGFVSGHVLAVSVIAIH